jgi:hypothetical protein
VELYEVKIDRDENGQMMLNIVAASAAWELGRGMMSGIEKKRGKPSLVSLDWGRREGMCNANVRSNDGEMERERDMDF